METNLIMLRPGDGISPMKLNSVVGEIVNMPDLEGDLSLYAGGLSRMDKTHFLNPHIHILEKIKFRCLLFGRKTQT